MLQYRKRKTFREVPEKMMHIEVLIYAYFLITILCILKRLEKKIRNHIKEKRQVKKKKIYEEEVKDEINRLKTKKRISEEHILLMQKELKKTSNLYILEDILTEQREKKPENVEKYCIAISPLFQILINEYKEKDSVQKAYFMHVLLEFPSLMQNDDNSINYAMMHFVFDKSIYARENAMLFFYRKGLEHPVVNSLKKISKRNLHYSSKLLTDDLLTFTGNEKSLISLLLAEFNELKENFQVAIINYIRLNDADKKEDIYQKLISRKYEKNVELAMIRYFSNNKYDPIVNFLTTIMKDKDMFSSEYRIVTASTLKTYDSKETRKLLVNGLCDKNFYVRKNSAVSLSKMDVSMEELKNAMKVEDKFAREMLEYVWQEKCYNNTPRKKKRK